MSAWPALGSPLVELRQYTLHSGGRAALTALFDRHLTAGQLEAGMRVGPLMADEDDADRFVWFRGFTSLHQRTRALHEFYDGPVWQRHRDAANATMVDSDNVLLLRPSPVGADSPGAWPSGAGEWPVGPDSVYLCAVQIDDGAGAAFRAVPVGAPPPLRALRWVTHAGPNGFPRLPVRDVRAIVWLAAYPDEGSRDAACLAVAAANLGVFAGRDPATRPGSVMTGSQLLRLRPLAPADHVPAIGRNP